MKYPDTSFQYISVRRRVVITVGIFTVLTVVIGLYGLAAITETNRRLHESVVQGQDLIRIVDEGRQAEVHFKRQVQEWKNILLRGNDPHLYDRHLRAFEDEDRRVRDLLQSLLERTAAMGLSVPDLQAAIETHRQLGHRYREALKNYRPSDLRSAVLVDRMVRGIDREPTDRIDAIVSHLKVQAGSRLNALETLSRIRLEAYRSFSAVLVFLVLAAIGFGVYNARSILGDLPPDDSRETPTGKAEGP